MSKSKTKLVCKGSGCEQLLRSLTAQTGLLERTNHCLCRLEGELVRCVCRRQTENRTTLPPNASDQQELPITQVHPANPPINANTAKRSIGTHIY